mmetsp:Transcript_39218/g.125914  ORF Transcript_39218/g.125914 Transcript_39218/m.125914 type:complete len:213 (-) Transcript_39218:487-1125(-)|eukprot:CAMPEP_0204187568 /NCGR_PEP_ID=MMETSP0361-20130328/56916_1 /ASSEMBLY_ACC=CAM_ASM_000343 /TAXON_ID=268821 /ORGANISM="Scrippsiella Hangoei, Strain SHTV-5" /LENGTH=212 /DNA_ID=CAMNT_0051147993 /DNA_START=30 /DNA_END=668 /DNA_ORIENTATION=-
MRRTGAEGGSKVAAEGGGRPEIGASALDEPHQICAAALAVHAQTQAGSMAGSERCLAQSQLGELVRAAVAWIPKLRGLEGPLVGGGPLGGSVFGAAAGVGQIVAEHMGAPQWPQCGHRLQRRGPSSQWQAPGVFRLCGDAHRPRWNITFGGESDVACRTADADHPGPLKILGRQLQGGPQRWRCEVPEASVAGGPFDRCANDEDESRAQEGG